MLTPEAFLPVLSGQDRSSRARLLRTLLTPAGWLYGVGMLARNQAYDWGFLRSHRVEVPVVSVGNLTLGGTGKTPFVAWLARWFRTRGVRVTVISRGYGAYEGSRNDEAKVLELALPDVPHLQNPDRVAAAQMAVLELETQLVILDDGFQHRRLARDLDIVLFDALEPFGFGHVFPRGLLREPLRGVRRAQVVILSKADLVSEKQRDDLRQKLRRLRPQATWAEVAHRPVCWVNAVGRTLPLDGLRPERIVAFCGIANPEAFRRTLERLGHRPVNFRVFPDHHPYSRNDVADLTHWAVEQRATAVVCTEKDLVKIGLGGLGSVPLWALRIDVEFLVGQQDLERLLEPLVERALQGGPITAAET